MRLNCACGRQEFTFPALIFSCLKLDDAPISAPSKNFAALLVLMLVCTPFLFELFNGVSKFSYLQYFMFHFQRFP